ncbi:MAG: ROK family protein [Tropicimonas sp.]|uniref:ROK family transcriptional regulator n=1 Tax=Tropicimonas sp. TaxID=2067044 RepID=UPI003A8990B4
MSALTKQNSRRLITLLRSTGPMTRVDIASALNVRPSTVTRLVSELLDGGILTEEPDPARRGRRGYPSKLVKLEAGGLLSAGVFVDPDRLFTCIADSHGKILAEASRPIRDRHFQVVFGEASQMMRTHLARLKLAPDDLLGCGVSYTGQHTNQPGKVMRTAYLADWPEIDARTDLAPFFDMPVHQLNDAKTACLAELLFGVCKPIRNFCYIWLSHGIGGAAVINQNLYLGRDKVAAEFGGLFPKSAPRPSGQDLLNTLVGTGYVVERLEDISPEVLSGPVVEAWVNRAIEQLRWLSLIIMRTFAPDAIVIGGRLSEPIMDRICAALSAVNSLGEDYAIDQPTFLRAALDSKPQLGAAALPFYFETNTALNDP